MLSRSGVGDRADTTHACTHRSEIALPAPLSRTRTPLSQRHNDSVLGLPPGRDVATEREHHHTLRGAQGVASAVSLATSSFTQERTAAAGVPTHAHSEGSEGGCVRHSCECVRGMERVDEPFEEPSGILCCVHSLWTLCLTLTLRLGLG